MVNHILNWPRILIWNDTPTSFFETPEFFGPVIEYPQFNTSDIHPPDFANPVKEQVEECKELINLVVQST